MVKITAVSSLLFFVQPAALFSGKKDDAPPKLVIVLSVDQMRADFIDRFDDLFDAFWLNRSVMRTEHQQTSVSKPNPSSFNNLSNFMQQQVVKLKINLKV